MVRSLVRSHWSNRIQQKLNDERVRDIDEERANQPADSTAGYWTLVSRFSAGLTGDYRGLVIFRFRSATAVAVESAVESAASGPLAWGAGVSDAEPSPS